MIRQVMAQKNIRVSDIAKMVGVSHVAVLHVINFRSKSERISQAVAAAIDLPVSEVFPDKEAA